MIKPFKSIFKNQLDENRCLYMHPKAVMLMCEMAVWAWDNGCPFVVTETVTTLQQDNVLKRVSSSHREGRAFDVSTRDWKPEQIALFKNHFNTKYGSLGALSGASLKPTLIVQHNTGSGDHFHVQLNKTFGNAEVIK